MRILRPNFAEHPIDGVAIGRIVEIGEEENVFTRFERKAGGAGGGNHRHGAGPEIRIGAEEGLAIVFGNGEEDVGAAIDFHFASGEIVGPFVVGPIFGEVGELQFAKALLVVGEDGDESVGRKMADIFEVMFRDGNSVPKPVEQDG